MEIKEIDTFYAASPADWRAWLAENHVSKQSIWLIYYGKKSNVPSLSWSEAVDEALCYGWIDSTRKTLDKDSSIQYFSKRKAKSTWSKVNKAKIIALTEAGLMTEMGVECVERAKQNGSWTIIDSVEDLIIPDDLEKIFSTEAGLKDFFLSQSKTVRKGMLHRLVMAKTEPTRQKRINEIIDAYAAAKMNKI